MDKALKQRLVGASVLIILAVIVLPMLLSGRSDTLKQESRQIELPPKPEELSFETRRFPIGTPNQPVPVPGPGQAAVNNDEGVEQERPQPVEIEAASASIESPDSSPPTDVDIAAEPVAATETDDPVTEESPIVEAQPPASIPVKPPEVTSIILKPAPDKNLDITEPADVPQDSPRYLVQVASFSNEKNANGLASLLLADNLPVLMDVVDRPAGRLHRVRVGPFAERSEADALVSNLRGRMTDLNPRVLDLRPGDSAPVSTPSDPLVRWVVQVGSFNSLESAEALVTKLRLAGLAAFSEKVTTANNTTYKVRIGPELDRDKAKKLARKVKADHNLDGFVITQE